MRSILCAVVALVTVAAIPAQRAEACHELALGYALDGGCGVNALSYGGAQFGYANSGFAQAPVQYVSNGFGGGFRGSRFRGGFGGGFGRGFGGGGFRQQVVVADPFFQPPPQTVIIQQEPLGLFDIAAPFIFRDGFRGGGFGRGFDRGFGRSRGFSRGGFGGRDFGRGRGFGRRF